MVYVRRVDILDYCSLNIKVPKVSLLHLLPVLSDTRKTKLNEETTIYCTGFYQIFGTPCISHVSVPYWAGHRSKRIHSLLQKNIV